MVGLRTYRTHEGRYYYMLAQQRSTGKGEVGGGGLGRPLQYYLHLDVEKELANSSNSEC